jgi:hypothetical protein
VMPLTNDYERAAMLLLRAADDGALSLAGTGIAAMVDSETFGTELRHLLPSHRRACGPRHPAGLRPIPLDRRFNPRRTH